MYEGLNADGSTHHYAPCGLHPCSLALHASGTQLQLRLFPILRLGTEEVIGCPAFFDLSTPRAMTRSFHAVCFKEVRVKPFYRANDYFAFFTPAHIVVTLFENICRLLGANPFSSGIVISTRKN